MRNGTWLRTHPMFEVFLVTLVTSVLCFVNPYTRMGGTELVYNLFAECRQGSANTHEGLCVLHPPEQALPVIKAIATALAVKGGLTIVTFGVKLPAGIFIPSLGGEWRVLYLRAWEVLNICCVLQWAHARAGSWAYSCSGCSTRIRIARCSRRATATSTASSPGCTPWSGPLPLCRASRCVRFLLAFSSGCLEWAIAEDDSVASCHHV